MKNKLKYLLLILPALMLMLAACEDDSIIGSSLTEGAVKIYVDSSFAIKGRSVAVKSFDSRSKHLLLGRLTSPEYGTVSCKFVAQLMPSMDMYIPDSISVERVDSMCLNLAMAKGYVTGDSLLPQQLNVYPLSKQLPADINNTFNACDYYDAGALLGRKSFTPSALGMTDSLRNLTTLNVQVKMPANMGRDFFSTFRDDPATFASVSSFAKYFPGICVEPVYGKGCVEAFSSASLTTYYYYYITRTTVEDGESVTRQVLMKDSVNMAFSAPEMISGNVIDYTPSQNLLNRIAQGECIIASPAGFNAEIDFPAQEIVDKYRATEHNLATINNLIFSLPVTTLDESYGLSPAPMLLMLKSKDLDEFFATNTLPDGKNAFWASYNSNSRTYTFTSMRDYIVNLVEKGEDIDPEDARFTLIPVYIQTETGQYTQEEYVTVCTPYMLRPTLARIDLARAKTVLTFSLQTLQ